MTRRMLSVQVVWPFRSPYSHLATGRRVDLHARYADDVQVRPVLPVAVRMPELFQRVNPLFPQDFSRDVLRLGESTRFPSGGCGLPFLDEVSRVLWDGSVEGWNEGSHLSDATWRAGLDLDELDEQIEKDPQYFIDAIEQNHQALQAAGHWGVPTMVFEGEPFFGQDRLELLLWRLRSAGLEERR